MLAEPHALHLEGLGRRLELPTRPRRGTAATRSCVRSHIPPRNPPKVPRDTAHTTGTLEMLTPRARWRGGAGSKRCEDWVLLPMPSADGPFPPSAPPSHPCPIREPCRTSSPFLDARCALPCECAGPVDEGQDVLDEDLATSFLDGGMPVVSLGVCGAAQALALAATRLLACSPHTGTAPLSQDVRNEDLATSFLDGGMVSLGVRVAAQALANAAAPRVLHTRARRHRSSFVSGWSRSFRRDLCVGWTAQCLRRHKNVSPAALLRRIHHPLHRLLLLSGLSHLRLTSKYPQSPSRRLYTRLYDAYDSHALDDPSPRCSIHPSYGVSTRASSQIPIRPAFATGGAAALAVAVAVQHDVAADFVRLPLPVSLVSSRLAFLLVLWRRHEQAVSAGAKTC
ncbi:hypothetical protein HMN09_00571700 [Mycena chlorophos]|uniref:Uncharacterized protein n=1 Tax=Mycena chlorophos TaxID=658473 RepID=A0A8H6TCC7_MYCCL|nr:hypothetical protein HMN09_00571700 [Mycena chlorophos]